MIEALQQTALALIARDVDRIPFWRMVATPIEALEGRAHQIVDALGHSSVRPAPTEALPGAGSAPGVSIPSFGVRIDGDHVDGLRSHARPVIARAADGFTVLDLRAVDPADDATIIAAIGQVLGAPER